MLKLTGLTGLLLLIGLQATAAEPSLQDIAFPARCDGSEQRYVMMMIPAEFAAAQSHDLLIALHGHGADRWQFARDNRDECRAACDVAARHGMLYVSPDYRAKTSWIGPQAEADVVQIIGELKQQFRIGKVFVCGGSMGGTSALAFAALHCDGGCSRCKLPGDLELQAHSEPTMRGRIEAVCRDAGFDPSITCTPEELAGNESDA